MKKRLTVIINLSKFSQKQLFLYKDLNQKKRFKLHLNRNETFQSIMQNESFFLECRHHALIHGNVEQITAGIIQLSQKRLDILRQLVPLAEIFVGLNSLTAIASGATG